ncbi:hypothetical protein [Microbulbifer sp. SAOS-129_SWC]|uniref:hypothetical protein n=1 Tax=Microbulbifer sp. SAOS-129_SWC TaxID=3145235 RepID=UPI003217C703
MRFVFLFLLLPGIAYSSCDQSQRQVYGSEPTASELYEATKSIDNGAWQDGEFGTEKFFYLGHLKSRGKTVYATYLSTDWGLSECSRITNRLIFFDKHKKEIAQYYGVQKPEIKNGKLEFPKGETGLSSVDIIYGLPEQLNDGNDIFPIDRAQR